MLAAPGLLRAAVFDSGAPVLGYENTVDIFRTAEVAGERHLQLCREDAVCAEQAPPMGMAELSRPLVAGLGGITLHGLRATNHGFHVALV